MEDEKLVALLQASEQKLLARMEAGERRLADLITGIKETLEEQMDRRFTQVDRRFDQINVRLQRMDVVWKAALAWGRDADTLDSGRDQLIADLRHDLTEVQTRLDALEKKQ